LVYPKPILQEQCVTPRKPSQAKLAEAPCSSDLGDSANQRQDRSQVRLIGRRESLFRKHGCFEGVGQVVMWFSIVDDTGPQVG